MMFTHEYVRYNRLIGENGANFRGAAVPDILDFLFQFDAEARVHAGLQLPTERAQIGGGSGARVIDQVGVVGPHVNVAPNHAFGSNLFQKPRGGDLSLARHAGGDLRRRVGGQVFHDQVLENAPGALHGDGELLVADPDDFGGRLA